MQELFKVHVYSHTIMHTCGFVPKTVQSLKIKNKIYTI